MLIPEHFPSLEIIKSRMIGDFLEHLIYLLNIIRSEVKLAADKFITNDRVGLG